MRANQRASNIHIAKKGYDFSLDTSTMNFYVRPDRSSVAVPVVHWANVRTNAEGIEIGVGGVEGHEERVLQFWNDYLIAAGVTVIDPAGHFVLNGSLAEMMGNVAEGAGFSITVDASDQLKVSVGGTIETITLVAGKTLTALEIAQDINGKAIGFQANATLALKLALTANNVEQDLEILAVENDCYGILGLPTGIYQGTGERWDPDQGNAIVLDTGPNGATSPTTYLVCRRAIELAHTQSGAEFGFDLT